MNKKTILLFILLLINIISLWKYKNSNDALVKTNKIQKEKLTSQQESLNNTEKSYENFLIASKKNENLKLNQYLKLITIEGDTVFAKDVFKNNSLVLRYSVMNCGDCIDAEIQNLEKYAKSFSNRIVIIVYYERIRRLILDYKKLQKAGLKNVTVYMLPDNKLKIPLDENNFPYYFHINPELMISNILIPIREKPKLSEYYLKYSFTNYFKKEI